MNKDNMSMAFGAVLATILALTFGNKGIFHSATILGVSVSSSLILRGLFYIVLSCFIVVYDDRKGTIIWSLCLILIIGLMAAGFRGWKTILVYSLITTASIYLACSSNLMSGSIIGVLGKTTFVVIIAMLFEAIFVSILTKANVSNAAVSAIIAGFIFGILAGAISTGLLAVLNAQIDSVTAKHTTTGQ